VNAALRAKTRDLGLALGVGGLVALLWLAGWMAPLERPVGDLLLRLPRPGPVAPPPVVAILVDDASVAALGPLPWPRARLAALVRRARDAGASAVVLDVILSEPTDEGDDAALAGALAAGPGAVAAVLRPDGGWLLPLPRFGGVERAAHAHAEVSSDGVVRVVSASKQAGGLALPALAVATARLAGWSGSVSPGQPLRPDFRVPPDAIPALAAAEVLAGRAPVGVLHDRVALVGVSASGAGDRFVVPVGDRSRPSPGVLVHAAVAAALLEGALVTTLPPWGAWLLALAAAAAVQWARSRRGSLGPLALGGAVTAVAASALPVLWVGRVLLPLVSLLTAVVLSALAREVVEARAAERATAGLLRTLLDEPDASTLEVPPGARGRLELALRLQDRLKRDRDLRRTLLEGLGEGVALWGPSGEPLLANAALERLWGCTPRLDEMASATGRPADWEPGDRVEVERSGHALEVEVRRLGDGHLGLLRDVTARRELDRRRREMQRLVSHELKTPLASIAGFGAMLERYELSPDELRRVATLVRGEAERLGEMVATFLDLERLGSGHWERERALLDLPRLVGERCRVLAATAAETGHEITLDAAEAAPVAGVAKLLEGLVDNLVGNALKYSPAGALVEVSVRLEAGMVVLGVSDHGPGIPEAALPHLFERFYRVPGSRPGGTGLGLALVREVAQWHGATATVTSRPGSGSSFEVRFPEAL